MLYAWHFNNFPAKNIAVKDDKYRHFSNNFYFNIAVYNKGLIFFFKDNKINISIGGRIYDWKRETKKGSSNGNKIPFF